MSVLRQAICVFILCWTRMGLSLTFAWPAFTIENFKSENTTLNRPMTDTEASLFASLSCIGALVGIPILGNLLDVIGRKKCAAMTALLHVIAWVIIAFTRRVEFLLAGIFVAGLGCSAFTVIPVYISDICHPSVRGAMSSFMVVSYCIGTLLSYAVGGYLQYDVMCYVCLSITIVGLVLTEGLKESPVFLIQKGLEEEAAKSLAYYRSSRVDSKAVLEELDGIKRTLNPDTEDVTEEKEKLNSDAESTQKKEKTSFLQFMKNSPSTCKALTLVLVLMAASLCQGLVAVQVFAGPMFKEAVPTVKPVICSIVLAVICIVASLCGMYLSDVAGRRVLMIYSSLGSGVCCLLLGSQLLWHWAPSILTAIFIYVFCFINMVGSGNVPYVLAAEVFLPEVKSVLSMFVYEVAWLASFVMLFAFRPLADLVGLGQTFFGFAVVCFATAGYSVIRLPETKGLTVDKIQLLFAK